MSLFRDIDKIDDLMADITEQQDVAREISDAISRPFGDEFDEVDTFDSTYVNISFSGIHVLFDCFFIYQPSICSFLSGHNASERSLNSVCSVCFLRMSWWLSWRSWKRRSLRRAWTEWADYPACPAPGCLKHGPVSAHVSATLWGPDASAATTFTHIQTHFYLHVFRYTWI